MRQITQQEPFSTWHTKVEKEFKIQKNDGVVVMTIPAFSSTDLVIHGITTRQGGQSAPPYQSLNLSFMRTHNREDTLKNYEILANALNVSMQNIVAMFGEHKNRVLTITKKHRGLGLEQPLSPSMYYDGMVTQEKECMLVPVFADCIPILLLDTKNKVIATCHAGWRGVQCGVIPNTIATMQQDFQSKSEDILAGIGPHIQPCCFEIDEKVYTLLQNTFPKVSFATPKPKEKYMADFGKLAAYQLYQCGLKASHVTISSACTCCDSHQFFSYRRDQEKSGAMGAFLQLKE